MGDRHYVLGIDSSTQSTTAVLLDRDSFETVAEAKIRYRDDRRLAHYGLSGAEPILPPLEEGEDAIERMTRSLIYVGATRAMEHLNIFALEEPGSAVVADLVAAFSPDQPPAKAGA